MGKRNRKNRGNHGGRNPAIRHSVPPAGKALSGLRVFLATPSYDGKLTAEFTSSLVSSFHLLSDLGACPHWEVLAGICYMPVVRNKLLKRFLVSEYTDLVFLDADIGWNPKDLVRLLTHDVDVVAAAAPYRAFPEGYPSSLIRKNGSLVIENGLIETAIAATAFLRIRKQVFGLFIEEFGERMLIIERDGQENEKDRYLNIFDTGQIGDKWWGEDTRFCDVYRKLGGRIWIDPEIPLTHTGSHTWKGHFGDFLRTNGHL